jgi:CDK-activating kinase assembly factor MAT1
MEHLILLDCCVICNDIHGNSSNLLGKIFKVNTTPKCGHKFCDDCINKEMARKRQFSCPKCGIPVTREKLSIKGLDETEVERDFINRRKIKSIYNKTEEDFNTLLEFQNYEEDVEDMIFNLVHGIDEEETLKKIEIFQKNNISNISQKQSKKDQDEKRIICKIKEENDLRLLKIKEKQDIEYLERIQKLDHLKQVNEFLLGDRDRVIIPTSTSSSSLSSIQQSKNNTIQPIITPPAAPSKVQMFLNSRPEPKPLGNLSEKNNRIIDSKESRLIEFAGGLDFINYQRRNWLEIINCIPKMKLLKKNTSNISSQISLCWDDL